MKGVLFCIWLLHWLPLAVQGRIGNALGAVVYHIASARRNITLTNLRLSFPDWSEAQCRAVACQHFQCYLRSVLERGVLWWAPEHRLRKLIRVDPPFPRHIVAAGPTILLCPHFVSLDVAGVAVAMETPGCSIYSRQSSAVLDAALRKGRMRFKPVSLFARSQGIRPVMRAMRRGLPFFMCPDMDFGARDALFVPFFGVPAATLTAPARIAGLTGARVIPVVARMLPQYRGWQVSFLPPWDDYPGDDLDKATRRMNAFIEAQVLQAPAEYLWAHRRFKTRPEGEPDLYADPAMPALQQTGDRAGQ